MVAFKDVLTEQQIWELVLLIRRQEADAREHPPTIVDPDGQVIRSEKQAFKIEVVARDLETPWGIAFLPDGRMLVTERPGRLRIVEKGRLLAEPVAGTPKPWAVQDGGLLDVEVHPRYAENGWIYLSYAAPGPGDTSMTAIVRGRLRDHRWVDEQPALQAAGGALRAAELPLRIALPLRSATASSSTRSATAGAAPRPGPRQPAGQGAPRQRRRHRPRRQPVRRAGRRACRPSGRTAIAILRDLPSIP